MQVRINLKAGLPTRQEFSGRNLNLIDTGAAETIDLSVEVSGFGVENLRGMKRGLKLRTPGFTGVTLLSEVDTTVEIVATVADIDIDTVEGATVNANILGIVPVRNDRGAPGAPVYVVGLTAENAPASGLIDRPTMDVGDTPVAIFAANPNRLECRVRNTGTDPVAIGAPGLTWAKRTVVLEGEDLFIESRAAALQLTAICPPGGSTSLNVQEVLA
ncbi:hypothetical protein GN316_03055 [Xylophilus sp. Kf1]|nr:hypothetical protein [Xylophilus sp. Kf1]